MDKKEKAKRSIQAIWQDFLKENPDNPRKVIPDSFYFCDNEEDANECAVLVVNGTKRATATSRWWYEKNKEPLPNVGDQYIVTDWEGMAIIETTKIAPTRFKDITPEFAETEGEGDKSLEYWRKVHKAYYEREMAAYGEEFDENMMIICEHFRRIYRR